MIVRFERYPVLPTLANVAEMEQSIESLFGGLLDQPSAYFPTSAPALDVAEYPAETVVVAEVPGVEKEGVKINLEKSMLTISGERKSNAAPDESRWIRREIQSGSFTRSVRLGHPVNADAIKAELTNGILRIVLPKADEARPREISIR